jgi:hypothetical protein
MKSQSGPAPQLGMCRYQDELDNIKLGTYAGRMSRHATWTYTVLGLCLCHTGQGVVHSHQDKVRVRGEDLVHVRQRLCATWESTLFVNTGDDVNYTWGQRQTCREPRGGCWQPPLIAINRFIKQAHGCRDVGAVGQPYLIPGRAKRAAPSTPRHAS